MLKNNNSHFCNKWKKSIREDYENFFLINGFDKNALYIVSTLFSSVIMGIFSFWLLERQDISIDEISTIGGKTLTVIFKQFINYPAS